MGLAVRRVTRFGLPGGDAAKPCSEEITPHGNAKIPTDLTR
jgi:hypothetical protein